MKIRFVGLLLIFIALACNLGQPAGTPPSPIPIKTVTSFPTVSPIQNPTIAPYPEPDLTTRPQVWFAPLPHMRMIAGRDFQGSDDFMELFVEGAPWPQAAKQVHVFELLGEWVANDASLQDLKQVVGELNRRGIAIAFAGGPINPNSACGEGIEGFAGVVEGALIANRIQQAGGTVSYVVFDEPFSFGSIYDGPNACQWTPEKVAEEVFNYVKAIRGIFPDAQFGSDEALWPGMQAEDLEEWIDAYERVNGEPLDFLHLDVDWSHRNWTEEALQLEAFAKSRGVEFGMFYLGNWNDLSDEAWLSSAGERVKTYEVQTGGQPDRIVFASWHDHPDWLLPETEPYTFTWFIKQYFQDKTALGFRTEGPGVNIALFKPVRVSAVSPDTLSELAVDGNPETWWGAGGPALQWIEIDLEQSFSVAEIRLRISQDPPGETTHNVYGKGPNAGDTFTLLHTFNESTQDLQQLVFAPTEFLQDIQFIRVETTQSPSWVSWREIEVIAAE